MPSSFVTRLVCLIGLILVSWRPAAAQSEVDIALQFFRDGGAYCFRLAPEGTNLSEETAWSVMMLTGARNRRNDFRIRSMDPGSTATNDRTSCVRVDQD